MKNDTKKFDEEKLEDVIIQLLGEQGFPHVRGHQIDRGERGKEDVLIKEDLRTFLKKQYSDEGITTSEIESIIRELEALSALDLYDSNKQIMKWIADGIEFKRENHQDKDLHIYLLDYGSKRSRSSEEPNPLIILPHPSTPRVLDESENTLVGRPLPEREGTDNNIYKIVNQLEIQGHENKRIPDGILYINGLPLVVFEFKSPIREKTDCKEAYVQITTRYKRDIPELFKYNPICIISDGVNTKCGSFFAAYDFYSTWRKITGMETVEKDGIDALHTMIEGLFNKDRLRDVIHNFIYLPDNSNEEIKILCRYPQYYAATKLFANIKRHQKPEGDGKGGTYFGATGCGKSYTMLFLARLLMKSVHFASPTIVLITDRNDLDRQLSKTFSAAKNFIGDSDIISVKSRAHLRELLEGRKSGGVYLTTIHKFSEDIELLTDRTNVICISDEAHRSQTNLDQKIRVTEEGVKKTYGFAKYLHDSLPNATYVGFTGTPVDATLDVFGDVVDAYTMAESVQDKITVPIVYEGRAAKVLLNSQKLLEIEEYYRECLNGGANEHQVEESKRASVNMRAILGDPDRLKSLAGDFVDHYESRVAEGSSVKGKAMFVASSRKIAYDFYKEAIALRPEWAEIKRPDFEGSTLDEKKREKVKPMERMKMIMTRGKDDEKILYDMLGSKDHRRMLDTQFKTAESNFKIAIVVDMWLTGFDVPFLDSIYVDKPLQKHNLIQTISRVNRNFAGKEKGLVIDYIGIKNEMNLALAMYSKSDASSFEDIEQSIVIARDHIDLLNRLFHTFDSKAYFTGESLAQLECLRKASDFVLQTTKQEKRFMGLVKRLKAAYDICSGSGAFNDLEKDQIHYYFAIRSIVFKLTKGNAPDTAQMNTRVREMVKQALLSTGVEEVFKPFGDAEVDIFDEAYLERIRAMELPNMRIKLLQELLRKAINELKKVNKMQGVDFTKKFEILVEKYNERLDPEAFFDELTDKLIESIHEVNIAKEAHKDFGMSPEEHAFYDILKGLALKYNFEYAEPKLRTLAKHVRDMVDHKTRFTDWNRRQDIKSELKMELILLLAKHGYPPDIDRDEVYRDVFEQAENFKKYNP